MPTDYDMARHSRQAKKLEEQVLRYVRVHSLIPLKAVSEQFHISELHAFSIISSHLDKEAHARERKRLPRMSAPTVQPESGELTAQRDGAVAEAGKLRKLLASRESMESIDSDTGGE